MSEQTVYAIASGKGGVGKTTTTVNLGTALAGAGHRVVVVDADIGMANMAGFVSLDGAATTLHDVLAGEATIDDALYRLADGISAIPSGSDLASYAAAETEGLTTVVERLRDRFDYVLLDVGAGISHETVLPLGVADGVILVSTPDPASVQDVRKTVELTERANGTVVGLVVTRFRPDGDVAAEAIADRLNLTLLGTIPEDGAVRSSIHDGTPVVVHAPESEAAEGYKRLAARLLGDAPEAESTTDGATNGGADHDDSDDSDEADEAGDEPDDAGTEADGNLDAAAEEVSDAIKNVDDGA
ncbi:MAG: septum site-determining protein MinD [Halobacteriales archaeon]|jgi:septum site-determining protein MinD